GVIVADVERGRALRLVDQRAHRIALVGRTRRQQVDDGLAVDDRRRGLEALDARANRAIRGAAVGRAAIVKRQRIALVLDRHAGGVERLARLERFTPAVNRANVRLRALGPAGNA